MLSLSHNSAVLLEPRLYTCDFLLRLILNTTTMLNFSVFLCTAFRFWSRPTLLRQSTFFSLWLTNATAVGYSRYTEIESSGASAKITDRLHLPQSTSNSVTVAGAALFMPNRRVQPILRNEVSGHQKLASHLNDVQSLLRHSIAKMRI
jgi:hypothetical protein